MFPRKETIATVSHNHGTSIAGEKKENCDQWGERYSEKKYEKPINVPQGPRKIKSELKTRPQLGLIHAKVRRSRRDRTKHVNPNGKDLKKNVATTNVIFRKKRGLSEWAKKRPQINNQWGGEGGGGGMVGGNREKKKPVAARGFYNTTKGHNASTCTKSTKKTVAPKIGSDGQVYKKRKTASHGQGGNNTPGKQGSPTRSKKPKNEIKKKEKYCHERGLKKRNLPDRGKVCPKDP